MKQSFFTNKHLIFILSFFSSMIINIGGEVSPSFIFITITLPFWKKYLDFKYDTILGRFLKFFYIIVIVQIIWFPFTEAPFMTQIKGIMITVSGLCFFMYYYMVYKQNRDVIKWAVLGKFLSSFVFINVLAEISGDEYGMWKFQIMPRIVLFGTLLYLWTSSNKKARKFAPWFFLYIGGLGIATGARSCGLPAFIAGLTTILIQRKGINVKNMKKQAISGAILLYIAYAVFYVPNVMNGTIRGGNTDQIKIVENPYNPINLLVMGRTDSLVPFIAFFDNPLTGWGYGTPDPDLKYHTLNNKLKNDDYNESYPKEADTEYVIPAHSVLGYYSCSYGIIVFIVLLLMFTSTWKLVYKSLIYQDEFLLYRIFVVLEISWNFLFSPMSHFKILPASMALAIVLSISSFKQHRLTQQ